MSESSSLASVVSNQTWKADDGTPLALFHKKFWGKSMKDEESEWRKSQLIDQDEEITDADDDIISGCYVLNISIRFHTFGSVPITFAYSITSRLSLTPMPNLWRKYQVACSRDNRVLVSLPHIASLA